MKQYFTKYLPVEGEIKERDKVFWTDPDKEISSGIYFIEEIINDEIILIKNNFSEAEVYNHEIKKVKLFLCSRDIQVGDKFDSANGTGFVCSKIENEKVYSIGGLHSEVEEVPHSAQYSYKIIGEVSSSNTWVTEGMEFDRNDFQMIWSNGKQRKLSRYDLMDIEIEPILIAEFKCPTCKQFH